jgi:hypothetical protein
VHSGIDLIFEDGTEVRLEAHKIPEVLNIFRDGVRPEDNLLIERNMDLVGGIKIRGSGEGRKRRGEVGIFGVGHGRLSSCKHDAD